MTRPRKRDTASVVALVLTVAAGMWLWYAVAVPLIAKVWL